MAESQLMCMDDGKVTVKIVESNSEFYYCEAQRAALNELVRDGDGAFKNRLKEDKAKDFLSAREIKRMQSDFRRYETEGGQRKDSGRPGAPSEQHSTYWPQASDRDVPPLDMGWWEGVRYKPATRVTVYTHPPKENEPFIKEVVRRHIQESRRVVAVVMDLLTDLHILQDLLDAAKRRVAVYIVLELSCLPHFLDMGARLQVDALHLESIRVRTVEGFGLALSLGKLPGTLDNRYMLVDGEKVLFGTYSFTWTSSRLNRSMLMVMSGQVVEFYDYDFRELYAISEYVDLYKEWHLSKFTGGSFSRRSVVLRAPSVRSTTRFQVSLGDPRLRIPDHKYYNPKYALVVGSTLAPPSTPQIVPDTPEQNAVPWAQVIMEKFLQSNPKEADPVPSLLEDEEGAGPSTSGGGDLGNASAEKKPSRQSIFKSRKAKQTEANSAGGMHVSEKGAKSPSQVKGRKKPKASSKNPQQMATSQSDNGSSEQKQSQKSCVTS